MINAQDIKIGTAIRMDGKIYFCIDFLHVKPNLKMYVLNVVLTSTCIRKVMIISS